MISLEQAKNEIAKTENFVNWDAFESVHFYGTQKWKTCFAAAAELYASSRVREVEEEIESLKKINDTRQVEINLDALSCAVADAEEEIEQRFKKEQNEELLNALRRVASLEEQNKRLQERLKAADHIVYTVTENTPFWLNVPYNTELAIKKYNSLKP